MKRYMHVIMCGLLCSLHISCAGVSRQPAFTAITGQDVQPVKLIKKILSGENSVSLFFTGETTLNRAEFFLPAAGKTVECSVEPLIVSDDFFNEPGIEGVYTTCTAFKLTPSESIGIGEKFIVKGSAADMEHSTLDFALPFEGSNTRPAQLRITELRPLYSSKPKSEFIELLVVESGNLSGLTLMNVGDKQHPHHVFPPAEVTKGEIIVYHWRTVEKGVRDETDAEIISGGTQACASARDFWGPFKSIPRRNANAVLVKTAYNGEVQDAVLYCTEKEYAKKGNEAWKDTRIIDAAKEALSSGVWQGKSSVKGAVITALTPSKSLVRNIKAPGNNAGSWFLREAKEITMGKVF